MGIDLIIQLIMGGAIAVLVYFLKVIHSDVRQNTKDVGKNNGKIQEVSNEVKHEKEMRQVQFNTIKESLDEIKELVKK
tara:strand:+ start:49 stop:282 length:234 start_codon:yes stop_codon:yes gene_type:complete